MSKETKYFGWTNRFTWTVVWLIHTDKVVYKRCKELVKLTSNRDELANEVKRVFINLTAVLTDDASQCFYNDVRLSQTHVIMILLQESLEIVNWTEIAESLLEELADNL